MSPKRLFDIQIQIYAILAVLGSITATIAIAPVALLIRELDFKLYNSIPTKAFEIASVIVWILMTLMWYKICKDDGGFKVEKRLELEDF